MSASTEIRSVFTSLSSLLPDERRSDPYSEFEDKQVISD